MERGGGFGGADQVSGPASKMYFRRREEGEAGDGHTRKRRGRSFEGISPRVGRGVCVRVGERRDQLEVCVRLGADVNDKEDERMRHHHDRPFLSNEFCFVVPGKQWYRNKQCGLV